MCETKINVSVRRAAKQEIPFQETKLSITVKFIMRLCQMEKYFEINNSNVLYFTRCLKTKCVHAVGTR